MDVIGRVLLFGGAFFAFAAQIYIVILAFKRKVIEGILCFIIPGYVLIWALRQETRRPKVLLAWAGGLVALIVGVIILSI
jgi:uncharacterized membrane protein